ncbi:MAG: EVE domain-containing protein [Alphaproteobacteria bacterium]|nr:EVE domain-containing protein [Alphaproteobacteria bacterium]
MAYWLLKSEAETWSWDQQVARGRKGEPWSGVRNHTAKLNLMKMKKGDRGFFYHSGNERRIVGVIEVIREAYPDPTAGEGEPWVAVDVMALGPMQEPVTLAAVKADPSLKDIALVKFSRLSVQPVTPAEWKRIANLGGVTL